MIGLIASIALVSLNSSRAKARDARKKADFRQISTALQLYYDKNGAMPDSLGSGCSNYEQSMQQLVDAGFLARVPLSPDGSGYCYYNYGPGSIGALMVTTLETSPNTTTGDPPSCRPWPAGVNWCDQSSNKGYCICNTY